LNGFEEFIMTLMVIILGWIGFGVGAYLLDKLDKDT